MNLKLFFLFLTQEDQMDFRFSDSSKLLKFLKKNTDFILFSKFQFKIVFLLKKALLMKEKMSKLLKILIEKFKLKNSKQNVTNLKECVSKSVSQCGVCHPIAV